MGKKTYERKNQFRKGHKGGPGRPKGSKNGSIFAREWAEKRGGWKRLEDIAMGRVRKFLPHTQAQVAMYLMDRAYGKPTQESNTTLSGKLTLEQILEASKE